MGRAASSDNLAHRPARASGNLFVKQFPNLIEVIIKAVGITSFCVLGFAGIHAWNAYREQAGTTFYSPETWLDQLIPLSPIWIWPYLSYYAMCFFQVALLTTMDAFRRVAYAYFIEFLVAFTTFALIPVRMIQPTVVGSGAAEEAIRGLYQVDPGYNIFPSLHVANAVLVAAAFWRASHWARPIMLVYAVVITCSTLLVKQHYLIDVVAGLLLGWLADSLALRGWGEVVAPPAADEERDRRVVATPPG